MRHLYRIYVFAAKYTAALLGSLYLFSFGFLQKKNRALIFDICAFFNFHVVRPRVVKKKYVELGLDAIPVHLTEVNAQDGNVTLFEMALICQLLKKYECTHVFEFGTFDGRTTLNLALNAAPEAKVHTIDLDKSNRQLAALRTTPGEEAYFTERRSVGDRFESFSQARQKIEQHYGDTALFDFSPYRNQMDMVFIDAAHSYVYVKKDSDTAMELLRSETGLLLWHDYLAWEGVTRALNELAARGLELFHIEGTSLVCLLPPAFKR